MFYILIIRIRTGVLKLNAFEPCIFLRADSDVTEKMLLLPVDFYSENKSETQKCSLEHGANNLRRMRLLSLRVYLFCLNNRDRF